MENKIKMNELGEFNKNDAQLWEMAQKRAKFKRHAMIYALVIGFIWLAKAFGLMWFTPGLSFVTIIWGAVIGYQYWQTYHGDEQTMVQKEFENLKREKGDVTSYSTERKDIH
ncbi:MAG TPA: 2TM domain-containing protein [Chitinophagales bacterium]|nr:2TM domain-containing protein [Chitinophagales bacterium]